MASGTFYPSVDADDGFWSSSNIDVSAYGIVVGNQSGYKRFWIRFPNVTIPQGSTIDSVFIRLTAYDSQSSTTVNENIYFNNADNAVAPTTYGEGDALAVTAVIAWNSIAAWTDGTQYDSPELKTILQTVVNRAGWSSGNALQVVGKDNSSTTDSHRKFGGVTYSSGAEKAELHVTWTPLAPEEDEISEDINVLSEFDDNFGELNEDVSVNSEFACLVADVPISEDISVNSELSYFESDVLISEDASVNSELIAEYTGELTENASVNAGVDVTQRSIVEISEDVSVNSEFVCYQRPANIDATLPMITADILGGQGGFLDATLPCITADIKGGAQLDVTLPCITASIEGKAGIVGSLNVTLPMVTANIEGKVETLGDIDVTLPMIRAYITGKTGEVGSINVTLPMVEASLSGYQDISGDINVTLPLINPCLVGTVDRFDCTPLRYVEPI